MIQSHEMPERMVELNGVRKYRINVEEVVRENYILYKYEEIEFNIDVPIKICETKVVKELSKRIEKKLSTGDIEGVNPLIKELIISQNIAQWLDDKQKEYDALFKTVELITKLEDGTIESNYDYANDCPTFQDWLQETVVVKEAIEPIYDEEGNILTEGQQEVKELVRPYKEIPVDGRVEAYLRDNYAKLRSNAYPPIEMFADAWVKDDRDQMEEYRRLCLEVKAKYPKE